MTPARASTIRSQAVTAVRSEWAAVGNDAGMASRVFGKWQNWAEFLRSVADAIERENRECGKRRKAA